MFKKLKNIKFDHFWRQKFKNLISLFLIVPLTNIIYHHVQNNVLVCLEHNTLENTFGKKILSLRTSIFDHMCNNVVYVMTQNPKFFRFLQICARWGLNSPKMMSVKKTFCVRLSVCLSVCPSVTNYTGDLFSETMLHIWTKVGMMVKCHESLKICSLVIDLTPRPRSQGHFEKMPKTVILFSLQDRCLYLAQTCLKVG